MQRFLSVRSLTFILAWLAAAPWPAAAAPPQPPGPWREIAAVMHVQTDFDGAGRHGVDELVRMARDKGIRVLIPADHDRQVMEYGLWPLRRLIRKRQQRPSVMQRGPALFLERIARANRMQSDVLIVEGVQCSPFYYWTGSPFSRSGLTAVNYRKELLVVGLSKAEDYRRLPAMHGGPWSMRRFRRLVPRTMVFLAALALGAVVLWRSRGRMRAVGGVLAAAGLALAVNHHPFHGSSFDPYHGDQGVAPYQEVIDTVNGSGGMVFWLHPESNYGKRGSRLGPVGMRTPHYVDDLLAARDYTGFEALYGDTVRMTAPGRQWDRLLQDYCRGGRSSPAWAIAGADFHRSRQSGGKVSLDMYQTVCWVRDFNRAEVMQALRRGRCYAVRKPDHRPRLVLERMTVCDARRAAGGTLGQTVTGVVRPIVSGRIDSQDQSRRSLTVTLVRGGRIMQTFSGRTPLAFEFVDPLPLEAKTYYRIEASDPDNGKLMGNPIFVEP